MTSDQLEHFRQKLLAMRAGLQRELAGIPAPDAIEDGNVGDQTDRSSAETDRDLIALNRARTQQLMAKVDGALVRIDNGTYGICEDTGQPIGIKRLEAQPTATLSIAAQEARERLG